MRILMISIAAVVIVAGSFARLYDLNRMVVWHDEVFSLLRTFGFDQDRMHAQVLEGRDLGAHDLLY